jgi:hypothetical protein
MKIQLKNLKIAGGEETTRFEASLYIDGKKAATVSNGGEGGSHRYYFNDNAVGQQFREAANAIKTATLSPKNPYHAYVSSLVESLNSLNNRLSDQPNESLEETQAELTECNDTVIDFLVVSYEERKLLKRYCNKETLFQLPGELKNEWRTIASPYSPKVKKWLVEKYGDSVCIANEKISGELIARL